MQRTETTPLPGHRIVSAAVVTLLVLTGVMLVSLVTRTPPHPPLEVVPFAIAPFLAASLSIGGAALMCAGSRAGYALTILFVLTALISFGPQKFADPNFSLIWPAVIAAQIAAAIAAVGTFRCWRTDRR